METMHLPFDLPLYVDWIGIVVGCASIWYVQKLRRVGKTLDRAAVWYMAGMGAFVASLVWERFAEGVPSLGLPHEEPHHLLMMTSIILFAYASSRFVPSKDELIQEIGERERIQKRLAESESMFRGLTEEAPVGISILGSDGTLTYVNKSGLEIIGATPADLHGDGWTKRLHPEDKAAMLPGILAHFKAGEGFTVELRMLRADGTARWVHAQIVPALMPGRSPEFISTFIDITESKGAAEALQKRTEELEKTMKIMVGREKRMIELKRKIRKDEEPGEGEV